LPNPVSGIHRVYKISVTAATL